MTVLLALLLDWFLREPPARLHPVVWMGGYLNLVGRPLTRLSPRWALLMGSAFWLLGAGLVVGIYATLEALLKQLGGSLEARQGASLCWGAAQFTDVPSWSRFMLEARQGASLCWGAAQFTDVPSWPRFMLELLLTALLLKPLFAFRMLLDEVAAVEAALTESLQAARLRLRNLVSRPTDSLTESEVRESALESLAENLNDSLVAPLFWFVLLGLPGAALYRFANTADALWGYRGQWEWAGKLAAKADDLLSFLPARLTGLGLSGLRSAWPSLAREAAKTPSPNSGWPMAAMALFLGVRLSKPGIYILNPAGRQPTAADLKIGLRWSAWVGWGMGLLAGLAAW